MAVAFRNVSTAYATSAASVEGTLPTDSVAGDLLVAAFGSRNGGGNTISTPTGWTLLQSDTQGSNNANLALFVRAYDAGPWTFEMSDAGRLTLAIVAVSGSSLSYSSAKGKSSGNATSHTFAAVSPTASSSLLLACIQTGDTAGACYSSWSDGLASNEVVDNSSLGVAWELLSAAGSSGTRTVTSAANSESVTITIAVEALSGSNLLLGAM